ncbi:flavin-dependent oxidoreductase [Shinella yambaruensis]|uniref:flavin-dependent oxidoreductase n=1 Tax=Shinella yambaruensis TaxID=415996 RepID=UPI001FD4E4EC|nr:flavin-dependent oxidoreductase [Shinella yambaruensis]MCJ8024271.1 flavin-dependent oxidoreductase [Shinella yambaruensis]MCU7980713.1 flavin-dependent oxidoreductase [Shinella yambaruensis]
MEVTIVGGGIGGLTLALMLKEQGIASRVYEAAPELKALGVGINLLPHAAREMCKLGLEEALAKVAITTRESGFYNRYGQHIFSEPTGRYAGYDWPQFSIHRGDLHMVLVETFKARCGADRLMTGWQCTGFEQDDDLVTLHFVDPRDGSARPSVKAEMVVSAEGIHSKIRKQLYPNEGPPRYSGINMWRGVTKWKPFLTGASMVRIGWLNTAKVLIYPIRDNIDGEGTQLINWVVDIATESYKSQRDWNKPGRLEDFFDVVKDWKFDWLDCPALFKAADAILEYPMVDQDPLNQWTFGRVTLLGDAAHPMYPRGANGSAQAILDCRALTDAIVKEGDPVKAMHAYEAIRRPATAQVVLTNRKNPPDAILREVYERTGDKPFDDINKVISHEDLEKLSTSYQKIAGYHKENLAMSPAGV